MELDEAKAYVNGILDPAPARAKRGAFGLILLSSTIFFIPLFAARFLWAYADKPAGINYVFWTVLTLIMIASLFPTSGAVKAAYQGENSGIARNLSIALLMITLVAIGIIYQWFTGTIPIDSRYGENLYTDTVAFILMMSLAHFAFMAYVSASSKGKIRAAQAWKIHNAVDFWRLLVVMWVLFYVIYFII
ncbi:hypothetical protein BI364_07400 [Acidihalobacter yilgarnensis]|uniref:Heme-copper oxidase subunit III family profile domain-containing protein n=1 Tax=Acidihalobacter yilgarnensis TaxID=2819280 RepID=A0A1D8IMW8_9GAMM|nr:hypothetical protein [Acidihalobacter yilgarnensis]AOU97813.1 hypothetical protein BI364_07400 [Acidihalobacter yilgarnensis]